MSVTSSDAVMGDGNAVSWPEQDIISAWLKENGISVDFKKQMDEAHADLMRVGFIARFDYTASAKRNGAKAYVLASNRGSVAA